MMIVVCDPVDEQVVSHFQEKPNFEIVEAFEDNEIDKLLPKASFLIVRSGTTVDDERLEAAENLVGIVRAGVGLDNIDLEKAEQVGVEVQNTPEASTNAVAELVIGHILAAYRDIPRADKHMKEGEWIKGELNGREIMDKVVGLVGFGRIGQRVGEFVRAFGADVIAYDAFINDSEIKNGGAEPVKLNELVSLADIISLHVPFTPETENLIGASELEQMKDDALVVNCSRGGIVDEDALAEALVEDKIDAACLDTYREEPPGAIDAVCAKNSVATPHLGATTGEAQGRIADLVVEKIEAMA